MFKKLLYLTPWMCIHTIYDISCLFFQMECVTKKTLVVPSGETSHALWKYTMNIKRTSIYWPKFTSFMTLMYAPRNVIIPCTWNSMCFCYIFRTIWGRMWWRKWNGTLTGSQWRTSKGHLLTFWVHWRQIYSIKWDLEGTDSVVA